MCRMMKAGSPAAKYHLNARCAWAIDAAGMARRAFPRPNPHSQPHATKRYRIVRERLPPGALANPNETTGVSTRKGDEPSGFSARTPDEMAGIPLTVCYPIRKSLRPNAGTEDRLSYLLTAVAVGFAMTLVRNETQRHSAALKSAGQNPIGLLPLSRCKADFF